jgi:hypothetical protein
MSERRFQERWREYLDSLSDDPGAAVVIDRVLGLGLFPSDLETLAKGLTARADLLSVLQSRLPVPTAPSWPDLDRAEDWAVGLASASRRTVSFGRLRNSGLVRDMMSKLRNANPSWQERHFRRMTFGRAETPNWGGAATIKAVRETGERARRVERTPPGLSRRGSARLDAFIVSFVDNVHGQGGAKDS